MALLEIDQPDSSLKAPGHIPNHLGDLNCRLNMATAPRPAPLGGCGAWHHRQGLCQPGYHTGLPVPHRAASAWCSPTSSSEFPTSYPDDRLEGIMEKGNHGYLPNPHCCFHKNCSSCLTQPHSAIIFIDFPNTDCCVDHVFSKECRTLSVLLMKTAHPQMALS